MARTGQLLLADVLDGLATIGDGTADLVIADPPYGITKSFGLPDSWRDIEDWQAWCLSWLAECQRILSPTGSLFVYGIHNYVCYNHVQLLKLGMRYRRQIIWRYENGFCGNRTLRATYEPLLWFSKTDDYYFEEIREPYKSADRLKYAVRKGGKVWSPHPEGRLASDVWDFPTLAGRAFRDEKVKHPTQKPLTICHRIVEHFSPPGSLVVIPFAGSGSECVAALQKGRDFIGIEINPEYVALQVERLKAVGWLPARREPLRLEEEGISIFA